MKKVIVIVGPTGSGKSALAIRLAKMFDGEIINGDSVQVYRGLDIGSAKVTEEDKEGITHHLLDIRDPGESYAVYQFQQDARQLIKDIKLPIIVGGTGLYIKAALYDYVFDDPQRSEAFEATFQDKNTEELAAMLHQLDPELDIKEMNRRRLLRALAMAHDGSKRSSKNGKNTPLYDNLILYLDLDRDLLEKRLEERLEKMFHQGLIDEVQALKKQGIEINAIGYRELFLYLDGKISLEDAKIDIVKHSRRLAKKQKTWFTNQMQTVVLNALDPDLDIKAKVLIDDFLEGA